MKKKKKKKKKEEKKKKKKKKKKKIKENLNKKRKKKKKKKKKAEYQLHKLIRLDCLEIHIALSNPNINVRILAQGYCLAIVSLSLLRT